MNGKYIPVPVIFLDRDGVINKQARPHEYITHWKDFIVLPGVYEALRMFNASTYRVFILSNQRCIARRIATTEQIDMLNSKMLDDFQEHSCRVEKVFICPHDDSDNCNCRKPKIGMFLKAQAYLEDAGYTVNKNLSWMIGDFESDIEAGKNYGVNTFLIDGGRRNLLYAARKIIDAKGDIMNCEC